MSKQLKLSPLALAVAALFASPLALAEGNSNGPRGPHDRVEIKYENDVEVDIEVKNKIRNDVTVWGGALVRGVIPVEAESGALVDTKQQSVLQGVGNSVVDNNAVVEGSAMEGAEGNIGLNVTAGDNNQQSNDAALSAVDAEFVFAHASSFGYQKAAGNTTVNSITRNTARLSGNALMGAQGNIGVNISAGNSNVQANALAASVNDSGTLAKATSYTNQASAHNETLNLGREQEVVERVPVSLSGTLSGRYAGIVDQYGNQYLDNWAPCTGACPPTGTDQNHPTNGQNVGHTDLDDEIQGAQDRPVSSNLQGTDLSEGGGLSFNEAGTQTLQGTLSGELVVLRLERQPHTNTALLNGNALMNATGNIGVNIAAGTNNLQRNSLAIAAARGNGGGTTPGNGE